MKKTIIALMALTGVAMGATLGEIDTTDTNLKAYWNFDTSNDPVVNTITKQDGTSAWSELPTWNSAGYGECTTTTTHPYTSSAGLKAADGFTISFDINDAGNGTLLSMSTGSMSQAWRSISITMTDGTASAQFHGATGTAVTGSVISSEWTTLTLVGSASGTTLNLDFYINGAHMGTSTTNNATNITGTNTIGNVQFGYLGTAANSASMNIDNILVYNKALTSKEVAQLIPEPATATLSLLALAGLAARRRRATR